MNENVMTEILRKKAVSIHLVLNFFDALNVSAVELLELGKKVVRER